MVCFMEENSLEGRLMYIVIFEQHVPPGLLK